MGKDVVQNVENYRCYCEVLVLHTQESLRRHEQLNAYEAQNGGTAVYGVNVFSDLTPEEFKSMLACLFCDLSHLTHEEFKSMLG